MADGMLSFGEKRAGSGASKQTQCLRHRQIRRQYERIGVRCRAHRMNAASKHQQHDIKLRIQVPTAQAERQQ
jgi:hypothetical protein